MLEVDILMQNYLWNTAVSKLYYSCFYAVSALLLHHNIVAKTHAGIRQQFGLNFVEPGIIPKETGRYYTELFDKRHKGDYEDFFDYDEQIVLELRAPAHQMIRQIESLLTK